MKKYYVSAIIQDKDDKRAWLCGINEFAMSMERALEQVKFMRSNHAVLSAWIDCCDENGKKMIFHECYVDCLGQVWKG